ncbi:MAG: hypothetical protein PVH57_15780 [Syntrophobacterales bacterium]|jgi:hypothetical protein
MVVMWTVGHEVFSKVTGGRASSFQGVTEWGTPWLSRSERVGENREGGGITRPKLLEMISPGDLEPKKRLHDPYIIKMQTI